jgi:uncharacterized protein YcbK (DUF882 family)
MVDLFNPTSVASQSDFKAPTVNSGVFDAPTAGAPAFQPGKAVVTDPGSNTFSKKMETAGTAADNQLGAAPANAPCATCPLQIKLEHKSRYTKKYRGKEWVVAKDFVFLIGQERVLSVRVAEPQGASATWEVTPIGKHSGTLKPKTGTGNQFDYTPKVTNDQRPITASRSPNPAVKYQIKATVTANGQTGEITELVEQDERDIIRNEFVDFRTWRGGFTLHVPYRTVIKPASRAALRGNYVLVLDSAMTELLNAVEANLGQAVAITSGWRNPRRNLAAKSKAVNSNHQHGGAVDMKSTEAANASGRRGAMVDLYNAALKSGGRAVILEKGSKVMYPTNQALPKVDAKHPDNNNDGLPDGSSAAGAVDGSDHVHIDRSPPADANEDD